MGISHKHENNNYGRRTNHAHRMSTRLYSCVAIHKINSYYNLRIIASTKFYYIGL